MQVVSVFRLFWRSVRLTGAVRAVFHIFPCSWRLLQRPLTFWLCLCFPLWHCCAFILNTWGTLCSQQPEVQTTAWVCLCCPPALVDLITQSWCVMDCSLCSRVCVFHSARSGKQIMHCVVGYAYLCLTGTYLTSCQITTGWVQPGDTGLGVPVLCFPLRWQDSWQHSLDLVKLNVGETKEPFI